MRIWNDKINFELATVASMDPQLYPFSLKIFTRSAATRAGWCWGSLRYLYGRNSPIVLAKYITNPLMLRSIKRASSAFQVLISHSSNKIINFGFLWVLCLLLDIPREDELLILPREIRCEHYTEIIPTIGKPFSSTFVSVRGSFLYIILPFVCLNQPESFSGEI